MMNTIALFLSGMVTLGFWIAGLFFLRFWSKTRDRLFLIFGMAFWLLAAENVFFISVTGGQMEERHSLVYLIRLVAFAMIIGGIIDKNRSTRGAR